MLYGIAPYFPNARAGETLVALELPTVTAEVQGIAIRQRFDIGRPWVAWLLLNCRVFYRGRLRALHLEGRRHRH